MLAAGLLSASLAAASAEYPAVLVKDLKLTVPAPGCDLCHHAAAAPVGSVDEPFGKSAVDHGLVGNDGASLARALDGMRKAGVDSDGDGAEDLDELSWGGDPNRADGPMTHVTPPSFGCSMVGETGNASPGGRLALLWLMVAAALLSTRRSIG